MTFKALVSQLEAITNVIAVTDYNDLIELEVANMTDESWFDLDITLEYFGAERASENGLLYTIEIDGFECNILIIE